MRFTSSQQLGKIRKTWGENNKETMNEDVSPIKSGDFSS